MISSKLQGTTKRAIRPARIVAVVALATGTIWASAGPAQAAAPSMVASSGTVAVGGTIDVTVDQCPSSELNGNGPETFDGFPHVWLITGSGSTAVRAAIGVVVTPTTYRITVPGWVDASDPAVIAGACDQHFFGFSAGKRWLRRFSYPDIAVDVTPAGGAVPSISYTTSRSQAAGGQVIRVTGQGCAAGDRVDLDLDPGADFAWREGPSTNFTFMPGSGVAAGDGSFQVDLVLNDPGSDRYSEGENYTDDGPLAEGPYVMRVSCGAEPLRYGLSSNPEAAPAEIVVDGATDSGSTWVGWSNTTLGRLSVSGAGCVAGSTVTVRWGNFDGTAFVDERTTTSGADGTWSLDWDRDDPTLNQDENYLWVHADCGDPLADGFQYRLRQASPDDHNLDFAAPVLTPPDVGAGTDFVALVEGSCLATVDAVVVGVDDEILSISGPIEGRASQNAYRLNLTAPETPGTYRVAGRCNGAPGPTTDLIVAAADSGAVPATPVAGSPSYTG